MLRLPLGRTLALPLVAVALAATACVGHDAVSATGDGRNYVAGSGIVHAYPRGDGPTAPDVSGTTLDGRTLRLSDYAGDVVVLNFWASWCPPCRDEADGLAQVATETKSKGVRFVGVNFKDEESEARNFANFRHTPYPSLFDRYGEIAVRFGRSVPPAAVPTTLVVDRSGRIAASVYGPITYTGLLPLVESVAAERRA